MFTQTLTKRVLGSNLVDLLTGPHGVDRYTELVKPTWTLGDARATIVAVHRHTPRSVTLTLEPNRACAGWWADFRAGQHITLTVEIDGRRRTRCYSPANAEGTTLIELTIGLHDGGLVSTYLRDHARPGMVVGLAAVAGDFVLAATEPAQELTRLPAELPERILFISGGSGITPVMSMLRTLHADRRRGDWAGEIAFVHYARSADEACYRDELAAMPGVRVRHGFTRTAHADSGDLAGHFGPDHLATAMPAPVGTDPVATTALGAPPAFGGRPGKPIDVYVCGPPALVAAVRKHCEGDAYRVHAESFVPPEFAAPTEISGGRIAFSDSAVAITDDGRSLLEQAEAAGLTPESGCRMGICHTCTRRKTSGVVKNLITGAVSATDAEDVQICVSVPVGDVELAL
jgi:ferredoxin-NADP reductase